LAEPFEELKKEKRFRMDRKLKKPEMRFLYHKREMHTTAGNRWAKNGASFKTLRTYRLKEGPGTAFFHEHDGECPKIQKYALNELKMPIFGNTSPSVYSTRCFFIKSNMLFVIAASGISASL